MFSRHRGSATRRFMNMLLASSLVGSAAHSLEAQGSMAPAAASGRAMSGHASADSAQSLVNFLTTVNRDEAALARLAQSKSSRADVRAYAVRVLNDHENTLSAWAQRVPSLSLVVPDSGKTSATRSPQAAAGSAAMANGVSEVRDTATMARGGMGSAAIHSGNVAALAKLEKLSASEFDAAYLASEIAGHDAVLKELEKHPTTYTELQTLLTGFRSMILDHRSAARKLATGG